MPPLICFILYYSNPAEPVRDTCVTGYILNHPIDFLLFDGFQLLEYKYNLLNLLKWLIDLHKA